MWQARLWLGAENKTEQGDHRFRVRNTGWTAESKDVRCRENETKQRGYDRLEKHVNVNRLLQELTRSFATPEARQAHQSATGYPSIQQSIWQFLVSIFFCSQLYSTFSLFVDCRVQMSDNGCNIEGNRRSKYLLRLTPCNILHSLVYKYKTINELKWKYCPSCRQSKIECTLHLCMSHPQANHGHLVGQKLCPICSWIVLSILQPVACFRADTEDATVKSMSKPRKCMAQSLALAGTQAVSYLVAVDEHVVCPDSVN